MSTERGSFRTTASSKAAVMGSSASDGMTGWDEQLAEDFIRDLRALLATEKAAEKELWMVIRI